MIFLVVMIVNAVDKKGVAIYPYDDDFCSCGKVRSFDAPDGIANAHAGSSIFDGVLKG